MRTILQLAPAARTACTFATSKAPLTAYKSTICARYFAASQRTFSTSPARAAKNRIFDPVRAPNDLQTLLLIHTSRPAPLITFWMHTYDRDHLHISQTIRSLIEAEYVGLDAGGVGYVEVEMDSPLVEAEGLRHTYSVAKAGTLLSFSRGEPQLGAACSDEAKLQDERFLRQWIETEAARRGGGGAGGNWLKGLFGS